jgi:hypothetical protein
MRRPRRQTTSQEAISRFHPIFAGASLPQESSAGVIVSLQGPVPCGKREVIGSTSDLNGPRRTDVAPPRFAAVADSEKVGA